jgi:hypothetical protein
MRTLIRGITDEDRKGKWFSKELAPAWITNQVILPQTSSNHDFWQEFDVEIHFAFLLAVSLSWVPNRIDPSRQRCGILLDFGPETQPLGLGT